MSNERLKEIKRMQSEIGSWSAKKMDRSELGYSGNSDQMIFYFAMLQSITKELIQELEEHI